MRINLRDEIDLSNYYSLSSKERLKLLSRKEPVAVKTIEPPDFLGD